jgi:NAD(P)-dependent dehydrogenase (short-subunit alcohol dehydrogenase family)
MKGEQMATQWTAADIPPQDGRVAVVTGANTGIGFETATVLAGRGAHVVLAVRNLDKGRHAAAQIIAARPDAQVTVQQLDLGSLESVHAAADSLRAAHDKIDLLINNAGVMFTRKDITADGFELQFGTNHLGHFAFTGLLLDRLLKTERSRVVTMSSPVHRMCTSVDFDDLQWERSYKRIAAYAQSKLANLLFTYELQRRLARSTATTIAVAAHPGGSFTQQFHHTPILIRPLVNLIGPRVLNSPQTAALSPLRAATASDVCGGDYYGPNGFREVRGYPKLAQSSDLSHDDKLQRRLWEISEQLTGVRYPL